MTVLRSFFPRIEIRKGGKEDAWAAGSNGQNGLFSIWFWSDIPDRVPVAAEELYEWRWNWTWRPVFGLLSGAVAFGVLWVVAPEISLLAALAGFAGFVLVSQLHVMQRRKELMSHEIGVQAAVQYMGVNPVAYRWEDIGRVDRPEMGGMVVYPWLKGMTEAEIFAALEKRSAKAAAWVERNRAFLTKVQEWKP